MEASLGLCQPERNNWDMEQNFSNWETEKQRATKSETSPTEVHSLDVGREKKKIIVFKCFSFSSLSLASFVLFLLHHCPSFF